MDGNPLYKATDRSSLIFSPPHYKCKVCNDEIWSRYEGQYTSCKCKAIAVDQTQHYSRYIGESENFIKL